MSKFGFKLSIAKMFTQTSFPKEDNIKSNFSVDSDKI